MQFLLDENVHHGLMDFLSALNHEAVLSPKGLTNGDVLAKAISDKRILITHDKDFATQMTALKHPGIIFLKIPSRDFEQLKHAMKELLSKKPSADLFASRLFILSSDRFDEFPWITEEFNS